MIGQAPMTHFSSAVSARPAQDAPQKHNPHQLQWPCFLAVAKGHPFAVPLLAQPIAALTPTIGLTPPHPLGGELTILAKCRIITPT